MRLKHRHLIFDPGKKSHPQAERVHGWRDWVLRHQDPFEEHADDLRDFFATSEMVVAHNASFDRRFILSEFSAAGHSLKADNFFCTMQEYRRRVGGRSGLDAVLSNIGLRRTGTYHGALEDAWMAMEVFLWLHDLPLASQSALPLYAPSNLRACPPEPDPLPRRNSRRKRSISTASCTESLPFGEPVVNRNRSAGRHEMRPKLVAATRPTAIMIMWVARSDGLVPEEISVVQDMVHEECERLGLQSNSDLEQDVAASLWQIEPTDSMVDAAAKVIMRNPYSRDRLMKWIRLVTYADGKGTEAEKHALERMQESFRKAVA
jgi:DNA polymerase-3 subunit epsilon